MNTENLKTFLLLSKLRNFTQTADELFIAQSTVTNRIAELERELGKPLFVREKKNITLTPEGSMFVQYAKRIVDLQEASMHELNSSSHYEHTLRVGSTNTIYELGVYPMIHAFMLRNPSTAMKLTIGHSAEMIHQLQEHLLDVVFSYLPLTRHGYDSVPIFAEPLLLVTSPEHRDYIDGIKKDEIPSLNYLLIDYILQNKEDSVRALFPKFFPFRFETGSSTKLVDYLIDGMGYSFLPESIVKEHIDRGSLITIPLLDMEIPMIQSYCNYPSDNNLAKELLSYAELKR